MRWATLPPSGRLPLGGPSTTLDPWPVGIPHIPYPYLHPKAAYGFEQSRLYRTKRNLMLVSKAWSNIAVEFMYESLVIEHFGVGRLGQVLATLEGSTLRERVKRIDIWFSDIAARKSICESLERIGLPNLRIQYMFPHQGLLKVAPRKPLSAQPLQLTVFAHLESQDQTFGDLRCLTLWNIQPLPAPFLLPSNLRRLTIIVYATTDLLVQNFFSTGDSVKVPNLTHLTLHLRWNTSDGILRSMETIDRIGRQLHHLTLTADCMAQDWTGGDLCTILRVCTQLTELVIPSHVCVRDADRNDYKHATLQTLGIPIPLPASEQDYRSYSDTLSRREAFPKLNTIRLISFLSTHGEMMEKQWLEPDALRLRRHGIRLEDYFGRDILPVPAVEKSESNQVVRMSRIIRLPSRRSLLSLLCSLRLLLFLLLLHLLHNRSAQVSSPLETPSSLLTRAFNKAVSPRCDLLSTPNRRCY